MVSGEMLI